MIIYDVVNIFSMKNYKSSRKLRVGLNWYPGVNWSTTTKLFAQLMDILSTIYFTCKILSLFIQTGSGEKVSILLQTQKIETVRTNFAVANRPSNVVSCIHVHVRAWP